MIKATSKPVAPLDPPERQYERSLLRLHELIALGQGESDQADEVRDAMDAPWGDLDEDQREVLGGLSADLYMLSGGEVREPADPTEAAEVLDLQRAKLYEAHQWGPFLQVMRRGPTTLAPWFVAFGRGRAYEQLGLKLAAARFVEHADALHPGDNYKALAIEFYKEAGDVASAVQRANDALDRPQATAGLLVIAAGALLSSTRDARPEEAGPTYGRVLAAIDRALRQEAIDNGVRVGALVLQGLAHEFSGGHDAARAAFAAAEELAPFDPAVREAKSGLAAQQSSPRDVPDLARSRRFELAERLQEALVA